MFRGLVSRGELANVDKLQNISKVQSYKIIFSTKTSSDHKGQQKSIIISERFIKKIK